MNSTKSRHISAAVLISGSGSNLQAIIDAVSNDTLQLTLSLVLSDKPTAAGLKKATAAGIATQIIEASHFSSRADYDTALAKAIDQSGAQLVILAGFMRILSDTFVNRYLGRLINIHPSLLPEFRGLHTHKRVLDAQCQLHGASVHFVTPDLDAGPIISQASIDVYKNDTVTSLSARVLEIEHKIYPLTLNLYAQNRLQMQAQALSLDGKILEHPLQYNVETNELY